MSNIIKFPEIAKPPPRHVQAKSIQKLNNICSSIFFGIVKVLWVVTVLVWPLLRWILTFDVLFQFIRMLWHWHTPNIHAGWIFMLHFGVFTALICFVFLYKPRGIYQ
ncbi:protein kleE (plasmid) [Xylella fastidiosa subsp. pauca]|uniref:KleE stable inheritance protein n=1 Tax=Xylella fastidiosa TaxID=2371 RepID=UPI000583AB8B|nr:KleE stable inheritance protein [Xylella fastidiosa]ARO69785.1 protein kleE [Xylella fastidiosa subsp. pauca]AVI21862.1 protein kleE [Xylella fastidiosa]AVI23911.1 protein kleE [Xylella fastidiosa]KIA57323.1 protein kleE [Xylella fastidiosa]KIA57650.1 protein kleE [Xylella fastidiosa]